MSKIEEKIDEAASSYGNAHIKNALKLDRDATFNEKCIPKFDAYGLETAFEQGAWWALSHQWVSVEEELPKDDEDVLALAITSKNQRAGLARCYKCSNGTVKWVSDDINADLIRFWLPIPPLPEARKEGEK